MPTRSHRRITRLRPNRRRRRRRRHRRHRLRHRRQRRRRRRLPTFRLRRPASGWGGGPDAGTTTTTTSTTSRRSIRRSVALPSFRTRRRSGPITKMASFPNCHPPKDVVFCWLGWVGGWRRWVASVGGWREAAISRDLIAAGAPAFASILYG